MKLPLDGLSNRPIIERNLDTVMFTSSFTLSLIVVLVVVLIIKDQFAVGMAKVTVR